ncbi:MAG TPA: SDR family oxidoreductase, partial [Niabella sp.]|nr:SDR family oxidoreductase [Niabella sp.]
ELLQFDVANREEVHAVLNGWMETNTDKVIEVLVNNAGIKDDVLLMWMKDEQWDSVLDTSLGGFFNVTRIIVNNMLRQRYGRIVNVVSLSGLKGLAGQTNYSAAKGGVIAATKALAQEAGKRNITVNAVAPGFIKTDMTVDIDEAQMKQLIPANRFGTPEEVAHAVGFFVTKDAGYITGQVLSVNGGLYT